MNHKENTAMTAGASCASYDIVYFVKNAPHNEELRYSLRSVEKNFPHKSIWIFGFCPYEFNPDHIVNVEQLQPTKWQNTRLLMERACKTDELTESFWLFNDDFFIMQPHESLPPYYTGELQDHIARIESRHGGRITEYTRQLRRLVRTLRHDGLGTKNYALHKPMLINRAKMLETLAKYPQEPMLRALYGNHHNIGGVQMHDCKTALGARPGIKDEAIISTDDYAFAQTEVGTYIKQAFPERSRFEVD